MSKIKIATFLFFLFSVLDVAGIIFNNQTLIHFSKPFILLSLIVMYVLKVDKKYKLYILALLLCFLGDVFLMYKGEMYFIVGLVSFLLAHFLFIKIVLNRIQNSTLLKVIISTIPFLLFLLTLILTLKNSLGDMLLPVIVYGLTISIFGMVSLLDYLNTTSAKSLFMFLGALVFIISDATLAINKFYHSTHLFEVLVMVTYILAQYLIFRSMILESKSLKHII
ncbi:lysoplasmalogenase [Lutibacter sp. B1]|uniref:lysoplasmalogenase n=1 Tax=Lutibacter sp. B1 TaxID=2725996 RepID=UPI001457250E|nr:lysoplasmalogenase [Lutibacter sp. B1]NLP58209.1 lysoplasmalogenase [Lutibacter sp. B1]